MSRMDKKRRQKEAAAVTDIAGKVKKKGRLKLYHKIIIVILIIAMIVVGVGYGYIYSKLNKIKRDKVENYTDKELSCVDVDGYVNILLIGIDSRDISDYKDARADAIIIASIEEKTGKVYLTSIYRDTYLKLGDENYYDKINHAFANGGPKEMMKTINQALDLNIKKYVLFNFKAVSDVVEEVDGINIDVQDYEIDELNKYTYETALIIGTENYNMVSEAGPQKLTGPQAVAYGRIRKGVGDDFKRTERMRTVIKKLLTKVKKQSFLKIDNLIDATMPQIRTNLSNSDILTFGYKLKDFNIKGSKGFPYTITTGYLNGTAYVFPADLENDVIELHKKVFKNKNYKPSKSVLEISAQIAYDAGLSSGQSVVDPDAVIENPTNNKDLLEPESNNSQQPQNNYSQNSGENQSGNQSGNEQNTQPQQPDPNQGQTQPVQPVQPVQPTNP